MLRLLNALPVTVACLAAIASACGSSDSGPTAARSQVLRLRSCEMTVDVFPVPVAAVRRRVPSRYELVRYPGGKLAAIDVWVVDCRRFPIGARRRRPATLAMIAAVVVDPRRRPPRQVSPKDYVHYLLFAQTNRAELAALLHRSGVPSEVVGRLRTSQTARRRVTSVRSRESPYVVAAPLSQTRDKPHDHFNVWWRDDRVGRTAALELRVRDASDLYCRASLCGEIITRPGSPLGELLGGRSRRARVSLRHLPVSPALTVHPRRCHRAERGVGAPEGDACGDR